MQAVRENVVNEAPGKLRYQLARTPRILLLEDSRLDAELTQEMLHGAGIDGQWIHVDSRQEFEDALKGEVDLILADYSLPSFDGMSAMRMARSQHPDVPFILVSGTLGEETAIDALKSGATDYVLKQRLSRLGPAAVRALRESEERRERRRAEREREELVVQLRAESARLNQALDALLESEERYRAVGELIPYGVWECDPSGAVTYLSQAFCDMLGLRLEECRNGAWLQRVPPVERDRMRAEWAHVVQNGHSWDYEYRIIGGDGAERTVLSRGAPVHDGQGRITSWVGINLDITDRKRATEAQRRSEERYRFLAESIPQIVWTAEPDGQVDYLNHRWTEFTGVTVDQGRGLAWLLMLHPDDEEYVRSAWRAAVESGAPFEVECRFKRSRDGSFHWHLVRAEPMRDEHGRVTKWFGACTDIDDRKRAADALRESEERFRNMADNAPVMVWTSSPDGGLVFFNRTWLAFTGRSAQQERGEGWLEGVHEEDRERVADAYRFAFRARRGFSAEYRTWHAHGGYRWVINTGVPRFVAGGGFAGYIGSCIDISDRKHAEETLRRAHDELEVRVAERTGELSQLNQSLQREITERRRAEQAVREFQAELAHVTRMSTMGEMASGLAHELNQPLAAIVNFTQGCIRRMRSGAPVSLEMLGAMEQVAAQATRAGDIIRRLRTFVKKQGPQRSTERLNELVSEVAGFAEVEARQRGVLIRVEQEPALPPVLADKIQIQQVVLNLVRNGLEAMETVHGDRVLVLRTAQRDADMVQVCVTDCGRGLPPGDADQIFQPFFTTKSHGLGMGLSISRSIIEAHGGRLWAEPTQECGATFVFTLPVTKERSSHD